MQNLPANFPIHVKPKIAQAIVPVVYSEAVNALTKCRSIDESKFWADKADALAAWAKIYKNNEAEAEAKRLKAHAYRRMSELAESMLPTPDRRGRRQQGAKKHLLNAGLTPIQAVNVRRVGALPQKTFDSAIAQEKPPGIQRLATMGIGNRGNGGFPASSLAWREFAHSGASAPASKLRMFCRKHPAYEFGRSFYPGETKAVRALISELREWLEELDASLPETKE